MNDNFYIITLQFLGDFPVNFSANSVTGQFKEMLDYAGSLGVDPAELYGSVGGPIVDGEMIVRQFFVHLHFGSQADLDAATAVLDGHPELDKPANLETGVHLYMSKKFKD